MRGRNESGKRGRENARCAHSCRGTALLNWICKLTTAMRHVLREYPQTHPCSWAAPVGSQVFRLIREWASAQARTTDWVDEVQMCRRVGPSLRASPFQTCCHVGIITLTVSYRSVLFSTSAGHSFTYLFISYSSSCSLFRV